MEVENLKTMGEDMNSKYKFENKPATYEKIVAALSGMEGAIGEFEYVLNIYTNTKSVIKKNPEEKVELSVAGVWQTTAERMVSLTKDLNDTVTRLRHIFQ